MSRDVLRALGACYTQDEAAVAWAEAALSLPPAEAWAALIDRSQEDAWWLIHRIDPEYCEDLADVWRRYALRAAAWAMLGVDATHSAYLVVVADADEFDRQTAAWAAGVARTAAKSAYWTAAGAARFAWTAAGAAAGAAYWAAEAARAATRAAGATAGATAGAATKAAAKQQLQEATPRVVEAWQRWLAVLASETEGSR